MQSSPEFLHFLPLRSKYSPQHPVLKLPRSFERLKYTELQFYVFLYMDVKIGLSH
jgi:hypothetical protein